MRELTEETGISQVEWIEGFRKQVSYYYRFERKLVHKTVVYFIVTTETEQVTLSHEHIGFIWLPWRDAGTKITFANSYDILLGAEAYIYSHT